MAIADSLTDKAQAGRIIQSIAPIVGGKGGGKPTYAVAAVKTQNGGTCRVSKILAS